MTKSQEQQVASHKWEDYGFTAPFKYVGLIELPSKSLLEANPSAYNNAMSMAWAQAKGMGVDSLGCCHICGTGLKNNFVCKDAEDKKFIVGCDCVQKLNDTKLVGAVEKAELKRQRELRQAKAEAKREERHQKREAELQAQRDRNGGLTDRELADKQREDARQAELEAKRSEFKYKNALLIDVLKQQNSGSFIDSMIEKLEVTAVADLSPRQIDVLRDIFGKHYGRRNSKKYNAAVEKFDEHAGLYEDEEAQDWAEVCEAGDRREDRRCEHDARQTFHMTRWYNAAKKALTEDRLGAAQAIKVADICEDRDLSYSEALKAFRDELNAKSSEVNW